MELLKPALGQLIQEITAVNRAWKEAQKLFEFSSPLTISLRDLKTDLQIRLLRSYAPQKVYLVEDTTAESDEPLYGLLLVEPVDQSTNAAHLPVRVAQARLSPKELEAFVK
ncbi:conserved hypothetical protein [Gloeothece citriformis PCC 7424]|uniref:Uncharacterized protein n=1 Tax=Gloeothece citriformis (strain PCC 7424) TaxID=65393 RepID=B7KKC6_GLOC7|nr:hypothetical protein [Gloeothece citriformis]ACK72259.1 conserved hypothetical protein [Gloeothece citriformis PCC 7424]